MLNKLHNKDLRNLFASSDIVSLNE